MAIVLPDFGSAGLSTVVARRSSGSGGSQAHPNDRTLPWERSGGADRRFHLLARWLLGRPPPAPGEVEQEPIGAQVRPRERPGAGRAPERPRECDVDLQVH